jgi:murein tripeptide amidase MpaA
MQMVDNYPTDPDVEQLVDTYDWYFTPLVNPDGYAHTWTSVSYATQFVSLLTSSERIKSSVKPKN